MTAENKKLSYRRETALQSGDLEATYAVHLRLVGKPAVDFLLVIIGLFSLDVNGLGATSEYRFEVFQGGESI